MDDLVLTIFSFWGYPREIVGTDSIYYPPEVRRGKYWGLGVLRKEYFRLVTKIGQIEKKPTKILV